MGFALERGLASEEGGREEESGFEFYLSLIHPHQADNFFTYHVHLECELHEGRHF